MAARMSSSGVVEPGSNGAGWETQHGTDFGPGHAEVVGEDEDRALLTRQVAECAFELIALGDVSRASSTVGFERDDPQSGLPPPRVGGSRHNTR